MRRFSCAPLLFAPLLAPAATAAPQDGVRCVLVVDPDNAESMEVAHRYQGSHGIPDSHVLYLDPGGQGDYADLVALQLGAFLSELESRGIDDAIDLVVLPPGDHFYVDAQGLISDTCSPVRRIALPNAYGLAHQSGRVLGGLPSTYGNSFYSTGWGGASLRGELAYLNGSPSTSANARRYMVGAMLGWTGERGNTRAEVLDLIDRSSAARGTFPAGTVYYMETTDAARSGPRDGLYPAAVNQMAAFGGQAEHLFDVLPLGRTDCMGVMTGAAAPDILNTGYALLPGSFADHLTSFAGTFTTGSQTKMSLWVTKGASGTCGTVEEPCNYAGKFPTAALHTTYRDGSTLGEAWLRHLAFTPLQNLFLGDALTRPYAYDVDVQVTPPPSGPVSGVWSIQRTASAAAPGAAVVEHELWADGVRVARVGPADPMDLDTVGLADGWHEVRVRAVDDTPARHAGEWVGQVEVQNLGRSVSLAVGAGPFDLASPVDLTFAAAGAPVERVQLLRNGRVVASAAGAAGTLSLRGQNLGAGGVRVVAEALFQDGLRALSAPVTVDVDSTGTGSAAPVVFDADLVVPARRPFLVELPASAPDDPAALTYTLVTLPAQASLIGGFGSWRVFEAPGTAVGADSLTFEVTGPGGTSAVATVRLRYDNPCPDTVTFCAASPNSTGNAASVGRLGSTSIDEGTFVLTASSVPAFTFGLFAYGEGQTSVPLGDGTLCLASNIQRLPLVQVDLFGLAVHPVDFQSLPAAPITAGSTWGFQFWYRDVAAGGAGFNLSDGLSVTFCP